MKKLFLSLMAIIAVSTASYAQTLKLGRIKTQDIITSLPESDSARVKMEAYAKEMGDQYEVMTVELNTKYEDYTKNKASLSQVAAQQKEKELTDIQRRIQEFQEEYDKGISDVQNALTKPIIDKIQVSVAKLAKAANITMVIEDNTVAVGSPIGYLDTTIATDLTPLVIKDLGGTAKPATTPAAK